MACPNSCRVTVTKNASPSKRDRTIMDRNSNMFRVLLSKIGRYCRNRKSGDRVDEPLRAGIHSSRGVDNGSHVGVEGEVGIFIESTIW